MYSLPTSIEIENREYAITNNGDFRMVLDCFTALQDETLEKEERVLAALIIFYKDINSIEDVLINFANLQEPVIKMYEFFQCGEGENVGANVHIKVIDWDMDSQLICSAINKVAGKEIRFEPYVHWWTFMAYYLAIGECALSTIVSIRHKIAKVKKLENHEKEFKRDNPQYFNWNSRTIQQQEADKLARELWNSNS